MHLFVIPSWVNLGFNLAAGLLALWKGDWRAKAIGVTPVLYVLFWRAAPAAWGDDFLRRSIIDDGLVLAVCLVCAVRATRYWVIWATAFALLAVISDLMLLAPGVTGWAAGSATLIWSYMISFAVVWGVWTTVRERGAARGSAPR